MLNRVLRKAGLAAVTVPDDRHLAAPEAPEAVDLP